MLMKVNTGCRIKAGFLFKKYLVRYVVATRIYLHGAKANLLSRSFTSGIRYPVSRPALNPQFHPAHRHPVRAHRSEHVLSIPAFHTAWKSPIAFCKYYDRDFRTGM